MCVCVCSVCVLGEEEKYLGGQREHGVFMCVCEKGVKAGAWCVHVLCVFVSTLRVGVHAHAYISVCLSVCLSVVHVSGYHAYMTSYIQAHANKSSVQAHAFLRIHHVFVHRHTYIQTHASPQSIPLLGFRLRIDTGIYICICVCICVCICICICMIKKVSFLESFLESQICVTNEDSGS